MLSCMCNLRVFPDDARGCQWPFVLRLHPQGCLRRGSRHRVLIKSVPGNHSLLACGTTRELRLEFSRETGLILRFAGKPGNPFQTKQGNRPSCRHQGGRRGSAEAVLGTFVFSSSETGVSGKFGGRIKGAKYHFTLQDGTWDFPGDAIADRGLIFR